MLAEVSKDTPLITVIEKAKLRSPVANHARPARQPQRFPQEAEVFNKFLEELPRRICRRAVAQTVFCSLWLQPAARSIPTRTILSRRPRSFSRSAPTGSTTVSDFLEQREVLIRTGENFASFPISSGITFSSWRPSIRTASSKGMRIPSLRALRRHTSPTCSGTLVNLDGRVHPGRQGPPPHQQYLVSAS